WGRRGPRGGGRGAAATPSAGRRHHPAPPAVAHPVERQDLHAVACRFAHRSAEVGPVILGNLAEHPHGRGANDATGVVEPVNLKSEMVGVLCAIEVVDVTLDLWPAARLPDLPLETEVALETIGLVERRGGRDPAGEHEGERERGDHASHAGHLRVTLVTDGNPLARISQRAPPSSDWKTRPSSVPKTTTGPAAARQAVSMFASNQVGSPSRQRSNASSPSRRVR